MNWRLLAYKTTRFIPLFRRLTMRSKPLRRHQLLRLTSENNKILMTIARRCRRSYLRRPQEDATCLNTREFERIALETLRQFISEKGVIHHLEFDTDVLTSSWFVLTSRRGRVGPVFQQHHVDELM